MGLPVSKKCNFSTIRRFDKIKANFFGGLALIQIQRFLIAVLILQFAGCKTARTKQAHATSGDARSAVSADSGPPPTLHIFIPSGLGLASSEEDNRRWQLLAAAVAGTAVVGGAIAMRSSGSRAASTSVSASASASTSAAARSGSSAAAPTAVPSSGGAAGSAAGGRTFDNVDSQQGPGFQRQQAVNQGYGGAAGGGAAGSPNGGAAAGYAAVVEELQGQQVRGGAAGSVSARMDPTMAEMARNQQLGKWLESLLEDLELEVPNAKLLSGGEVGDLTRYSLQTEDGVELVKVAFPTSWDSLDAPPRYVVYEADIAVYFEPLKDVARSNDFVIADPTVAPSWAEQVLPIPDKLKDLLPDGYGLYRKSGS